MNIQRYYHSASTEYGQVTMRLYKRKPSSVRGTREPVGAGGLMKRGTLLLFEQLEKLQLKLSSS